MKEEVFWRNPGYKPRHMLKEDIECDYLIVGGGVLGVSLAYFLSKNNSKKIVLIEKNTIGSGATGRSAGFLAIKGELDLQQIITNYGRKKGMVYWKANHEGLDLFEKLVKKEKIACEFEKQHTIYGSIVKGQIDHKKETGVLEEYIIEKDIEKYSELLVGKNLKKEINTPLFLYALKSYDHGASVNPLKFIQGFSKVAEKKGVKIYENTPLLKNSKNIALTPNGKIKFKKIIIATDLRIRDPRIKALRSTITISEKLTKKQLKETNLINHKMIWDSEDVYHYIKLTKDNRILLGYGDKQIKKNTALESHHPHIKNIQRFYKKLFPNQNIKVEYAWSGDFGVTNDRVPVIRIKGDEIEVGGASSQVVCLLTARHLVSKLTGKKHYLDEFFKHLKLTHHKFGLFYFLKDKRKKVLEKALVNK